LVIDARGLVGVLETSLMNIIIFVFENNNKKKKKKKTKINEKKIKEN
jgi:hypothetical protein